MGSYSIKDVSLVNILDRAEQDLQQLKSTQYVGRVVLATKLSFENRLWESQDVNGAGSSTPVSSDVYRTVTFQAESQTNPYGRLLINFFDFNKQPITSDAASPADGPKLLYYNYIVTQVADGKLQWNVQIRGPVTPHYFIQFSVVATDYGTVSSVQA